ncbi:NUDIX hydrolase [Corynebacterium rouxii]|uniref:NUDIX hydrolase n=1 Tax=Corynebacterium rouxii TaxID=2719119 RepID=UPI0031402B02
MARNDLGQIALVKQFRYPAGQSLWELPAGGVEPDEDPLDSAKRELQEECELSTKQWTKLTETRSLPNVTNFSATLFLAESLSKTPNAIQSAATREVDKVRFFSLAEIADMTVSGELIDEKTLAALFVLSRQLLV